MKKILCIVFLMAISFSLTSCFSGSAQQGIGKRPEEYPNTKWVCDNPNMYFVVDNDGNCTGEMVDSDGAKKKIHIEFNGYDDVFIRVEGSEYCSLDGKVPLLLTTPHFYEDKLVINDVKEISASNDYKSIKKYDKITFYRQDK